MTDRGPDGGPDWIDDDGPEADPAVAYERAVEEGQVQPVDDDEETRGPDVGDVYRSGS